MDFLMIASQLTAKNATKIVKHALVQTLMNVYLVILIWEDNFNKILLPAIVFPIIKKLIRHSVKFNLTAITPVELVLGQLKMNGINN